LDPGIHTDRLTPCSTLKAESKQIEACTRYNFCCAARRYEIVKGSEFVKRTKSSTYTFGAGELPEGNTTLWVHAVDSEGADVRASVDVYVAPKASDFNVDDQIFAMDVQQAAGSNDPSMLAGTASLLGTLTAMTLSTSQNREGRSLLQESGGNAPDGGIADVVRVKVLQLLAALVSSSADSVTDAATMRQVSRARQMLCLSVELLQ
jgi:hypothetical protein